MPFRSTAFAAGLGRSSSGFISAKQQQHDQATARNWFAKAEVWMGEHAPTNVDIQKLRAEAAKLVLPPGSKSGAREIPLNGPGIR